jgi:hypothetical protein
MAGGMHPWRIQARLRTLCRVYDSFTQEGATDMDELIRTLAVFGRPFPPELRELYFEVTEKYSERPRGPRRTAKGSADAAESEPLEWDLELP